MLSIYPLQRLIMVIEWWYGWFPGRGRSFSFILLFIFCAQCMRRRLTGSVYCIHLYTCCSCRWVGSQKLTVPTIASSAYAVS